MRTNIFILGVLITLFTSACGGKEAYTASPVLPSDTVHKAVSRATRFKIVQSTLVAKLTFKLDAYTGNVYQLVVDSLNDELWQQVRVTSTLEPDTQYPNYRNYDLFVSTLAVKFTYLVNVNTGTTWQYVINPQTKETLFSPMPTEK